jgi:hypothetical protein
MTAVRDQLGELRDTAALVLMTVIRLDHATYAGAETAVRLEAELYAYLEILGRVIDTLPPDVVQARRDLPLAELARLPGLLARPDIEPSVLVLRRTVETPMRDILRVIPRRARVPVFKRRYPSVLARVASGYA